MMFRSAVFAATALAVAFPAFGQGIPKAQSPEEVGFSATRLKRLSDRIEEGVKNNEIPGAVVLIARNGKLVMFDAYGFRDKEAKAPMKTDAIFRIASMTKPIVSVAVMMLAEEGKVTLVDPVSKYIPAFAETKVAVPKKNPDGTTEMVQEPQFRPMTVHDLLRHTSGLTYGFVGSNPVKQSYNDMKVMDANQTNEQMADKLARLALLYQPGTTWEYSMSTDVLGRVVEVASGMPLDKFIEERITKPLKMGDTAFEVGPEKKDRGARPQKEGPKNEVPPVPDVTLKSTWKSGGGGMVGTAADYARFLQMFANGGQLDGVRLLSRKSIDLMTADHLPPDIKMGADMWRFEAFEPSPRLGQGFGLGFAVRNDQGRSPL
ncbi:MAG: serine hydrolase domain-containing protein, partial [Acidimicrobiia bacterium]